MSSSITLSSPIHIDMTRLLMQEGSVMVTSSPLHLAEDIETSLSHLSEAIASSIGTYQYVVVSNKGQNGSGAGYFVLSVHPKSLKLVEQNGFQKCHYLFSILDVELKVNESVVDNSFIYSFLGKLDVITNAILSKKATVLGKTS
jgi:hypothetical protein